MTDSYRRRRRAALIVGTVAAAIAPLPSALAASFDCSQAAGRVEQLVCADTELGALDSELARVYAESRDSALDPSSESGSPAFAETMKRNWKPSSG